MYQEVCFNRGTEAGGGGVNVGHLVSPPSHFMLATGLKFTTRVYLKNIIIWCHYCAPICTDLRHFVSIISEIRSVIWEFWHNFGIIWQKFEHC